MDTYKILCTFLFHYPIRSLLRTLSVFAGVYVETIYILFQIYNNYHFFFFNLNTKVWNKTYNVINNRFNPYRPNNMSCEKLLHYNNIIIVCKIVIIYKQYWIMSLKVDCLFSKFLYCRVKKRPSSLLLEFVKSIIL